MRITSVPGATPDLRARVREAALIQIGEIGPAQAREVLTFDVEAGNIRVRKRALS